MTDAVGVLWGKSDARGSVHLLLGHLLDTAAVAEILWDRFLATCLKDRVNEATDGVGREVFTLVCGLHDIGKATPAFQSKDAQLADTVRAAGLTWGLLSQNTARKWHHSQAGAKILLDVLADHRTRGEWLWSWPLIAGHHGKVPGRSDPPPEAHGKGPWDGAQRQLVREVAGALDIEPSVLLQGRSPSRGTQLALAGAVIMADWIASDEHHFAGIADASDLSIEESRRRAEKAWAALGLKPGWRRTALASVDEPDLVRRRFGLPARDLQARAVELAERLPGAGLLLLEAPMGEGKTEAALAVAEVLARRFGADGVYVGMPTQATSDPMFTRVREWRATIDPDVPVALLHGKRRFNAEWRRLSEQVEVTGVDDLGMDDPYAVPSSAPTSGELPAEWLLGRKRGLLNPITVGTIDQLLHAATRTRHVMLRHAGLAGRVVILDEVHAYDIYMSEFLYEALRWLGDARAPVVLLSATLPPGQRRGLVEAYLQGALQQRDVDLASLPQASGYPGLTSVTVQNGRPWFDTSTATVWREPVRVDVGVAGEPSGEDPGFVAAQVLERMQDGGCALVVCNTVSRAQQVYQALRASLGDDVLLLHSRLTVAERATRTEHILDLLGRPGRVGGATRPERLVVVATQVAEQSFDVDADLVVSDLAPVDLLLQRAGRLHRHDRPSTDRPSAVRIPQLLVTGVHVDSDGVPQWPGGSEYVYGAPLLLTAAAAVARAEQVGWQIPTEVPGLVAASYSDTPDVPPAWTAQHQKALDTWRQKESGRRAKAQQHLLAGPEQLGRRTLAGLHDAETADLADEDEVAAVVRDGRPSVEVVLVRERGDTFTTLSGRNLGTLGEGVSHDDLLEEVLGSSLRLPAIDPLTAAARTELRPLPAWTRDRDPWLAHARALRIPEDGAVSLGGYRLHYDRELGLLHEREKAR